MEGKNNFPMECPLAVDRKIISGLIKTGDGKLIILIFRIQSSYYYPYGEPIPGVPDYPPFPLYGPLPAGSGPYVGRLQSRRGKQQLFTTFGNNDGKRIAFTAGMDIQSERRAGWSEIG